MSYEDKRDASYNTDFGDSSQINADQRSQSLYEHYQQRRNEGSIQYQQQQQQQQQQQHDFKNNQREVMSISPDDMRIIRQCNRESFYYRCLPLAAAGCAVVYFVSRRRNIIPSTWNYVATAFTGWFVGKLSYRKTCEEKLANSPSNSPLVRAIRRRRGMYTEDFQSPTKIEGDMYSDWERDTGKGYGASEFADDKEDIFKPQKDDDNIQQHNVPSYSTTYDDLRAKNRAGFKF